MHARFWQQPNFIVFVYFGVALAALFGAALHALGAGDKAPPLLTKEVKAPASAAGGKKAGRGVCGVVAQGAVLALACGVVALQGMSHWEEMDQHASLFFDNYAKALVAPLPPHALLLINYDMQVCANFRLFFSFFCFFYSSYPCVFPAVDLDSLPPALRRTAPRCR